MSDEQQRMNDEQLILRARQLELARPLADESKFESESLVGFRTGSAALAVPLLDVHGVRSAAAATPLPEVPSWLLGIVALEGLIVPVAAPDVLLGYADSRPPSDALQLLVLGTSGAPLVGLPLDILDGPMAASTPLQPLPAGAPPSVGELARGLVGEHLVLDVPALTAVLRARLVPLDVEAEQPS